MNQINASRRQREAAIEKAEAEKIMAVRSAEADAEAKHLSGMGTARMRQAITDGFKGSIESMRLSCGLEPKEVRLEESSSACTRIKEHIYSPSRSHSAARTMKTEDDR